MNTLEYIIQRLRINGELTPGSILELFREIVTQETQEMREDRLPTNVDVEKAVAEFEYRWREYENVM